MAVAPTSWPALELMRRRAPGSVGHETRGTQPERKLTRQDAWALLARVQRRRRAQVAVPRFQTGSACARPACRVQLAGQPRETTLLSQ